MRPESLVGEALNAPEHRDLLAPLPSAVQPRVRWSAPDRPVGRYLRILVPTGGDSLTRDRRRCSLVCGVLE